MNQSVDVRKHRQSRIRASISYEINLDAARNHLKMHLDQTSKNIVRLA